MVEITPQYDGSVNQGICHGDKILGRNKTKYMYTKSREKASFK